MARKSRPLRSVFLVAAEKQYRSKIEDGCSWDHTAYSCDNINYAANEIGKPWHHNEETAMYRKYFEPREYHFAWWPELRNGKWDHESRILALLLCAEMLRR
jgi:hypothetical protein